MLTAITRAFRTPDLRKKLLFTLGIIALFRLGSVLPTPGVNSETSGDAWNRRRPVTPAASTAWCSCSAVVHC